jgi:hypothetical protein
MNGWLIAVAFALGMVLTAALTIRRGTTEVSEAEPEAAEPDVVEPEAEPDTVGPEAADVEPEPQEAPSDPHGPGSARPNTDGTGPQGWMVKANEESMLYHSPESPSFGITRAEVWFRDVATAEAAGFNRWDSGKSQRGMRPRR